MKNFISWFEIPTINIERAAKFYSKIFDIELTVNNDMGIPMAFFPIDNPEEGVSGGLVKYDEGYTPSATDGSLVYLNGGADLSNVLDKVESAGGKVIQPKTQIAPEVGYMGMFIDTEGNRIALHSVG